MKAYILLLTSPFKLWPLLAGLVLWLTACATTPTEANLPLRVSWYAWPGYYPMAIAQQQALFTKHNVAVTPVYYETYRKQLSDLAAGKLDGAFITLGDSLLIEGRKTDSLRLVLVTDSSAGTDVIIGSRGISTVADLKGKKIGVRLGTDSELLVRSMLQQNGLKISDVTLIDVNGESVPTRIGSLIQAGHTWEPYASQVIVGGGKTIFTSNEVPGLILSVLAFRSEVVKQRPAEVQAFVAAWFEAQSWWQANPEAGAQIIAASTGLDPAKISTTGNQLFNLDDNLTAFTPGTNTRSLYFAIEHYTQFFANVGTLTHAPNPAQLLDPTFLKVISTQ